MRLCEFSFVLSGALPSFLRCHNLCLAEGSHGLQEAESMKPEKGAKGAAVFLSPFLSASPSRSHVQPGWEARSGVEEGWNT